MITCQLKEVFPSETRGKLPQAIGGLLLALKYDKVENIWLISALSRGVLSKRVCSGGHEELEICRMRTACL